MRLKHIQMVSDDKVPDHIREEINRTSEKIATSIVESFPETSPNILLGALNLAHSMIIKTYVSDDPQELMKCAIAQAKALILNVGLLEKEWCSEEMANEVISAESAVTVLISYQLKGVPFDDGIKALIMNLMMPFLEMDDRQTATTALQGILKDTMKSFESCWDAKERIGNEGK
jgi:hypothetical protein